MQDKVLLEIACFSTESAIVAQDAGAGRIELCFDHSSGGIFPGRDSIREARKKLRVPLFVMVRPEKGNFVCSDAAFEEMKNEIQICKEEDVHGIVFGILDENNSIDEKRSAELVTLARPMESTFHRAFDRTTDLFQSLESVIDCGFTRILTSGGEENASGGALRIRKLIERAERRIIILPGGGIRADNCSVIVTQTGASEIHSSALTGNLNLPDKLEIRKMKEIFH